MENTTSKTKVYNVIIMDRSGSMWDIQKSAIQGYNEVLGGIKADAKTYAETQEHFMTLVLFDSTFVDNIYWNEDPAKAAILTPETYVPGASTPLYDAIGKTLTRLQNGILPEGRQGAHPAPEGRRMELRLHGNGPRRGRGDREPFHHQCGEVRKDGGRDAGRVREGKTCSCKAFQDDVAAMPCASASERRAYRKRLSEEYYKEEE